MDWRRVPVACVLLTIGIALAGALPSYAAELEYHIKAAFLYNFAKFVQWPSDLPAGEPFVIGILGDNPFGPVLEQTIQGKTINQHPVSILSSHNLDELTRCRLLFIGASEAGRLDQILQGLSGRSVLTVSDTEGFASRGVTLNFVIREEKVRFEINVKAAEREELKISSQLLKLAIIVNP